MVDSYEYVVSGNVSITLPDIKALIRDEINKQYARPECRCGWDEIKELAKFHVLRHSIRINNIKDQDIHIDGVFIVTPGQTVLCKPIVTDMIKNTPVFGWEFEVEK